MSAHSHAVPCVCCVLLPPRTRCPCLSTLALNPLVTLTANFWRSESRKGNIIQGSLLVSNGVKICHYRLPGLWLAVSRVLWREGIKFLFFQPHPSPFPRHDYGPPIPSTPPHTLGWFPHARCHARPLLLSPPRRPPGPGPRRNQPPVPRATRGKDRAEGGREGGAVCVSQTPPQVRGAQSLRRRGVGEVRTTPLPSFPLPPTQLQPAHTRTAPPTSPHPNLKGPRRSCSV